MRILPNDLHGLVAIHLRHHDVHQDDAEIGSRFDGCDGLAAGSGRQDGHTATFQHAAEREDIADVIVDDQHLFAHQSLVRPVQAIEHLLLLSGQDRHDAMQEEGGLVEQSLG